MSLGNPKIVVRFKEQVMDEIKQAIDSANKTRKEEPYTISEWIRQCVEDKLNHLSRSRKARRKERYTDDSDPTWTSSEPMPSMQQTKVPQTNP